MSERDYTNDWDDPNNPYNSGQRPVFGDDPDYNGGIAPAPPSPRYDYNNGSPPDQALTPGHGWEWDGPQQQSWNANLGQWDRGVWQEREGRGLGYQAPAPAAAPATPAPAARSGPAFQPPAPMAMAPQAPAPQVRTPPVTDEVTKILMARLNELKNPGDVQNDPIYQQAVRANQLGVLRSADRQRKALAERAAAGGTRASGGFNVGVRGIQERAGEQDTQFRSGLALDRLQQRESQLVEAIRLARAVGQDDIANQLELQRLQLQQELGRGDLALRGELGRGQLDLGYDNLGFSYADLISRNNRDTVRAGGGF
jgi:hypothetical protein